MSDRERSSFWDSIAQKASEVGKNLGDKASEAGKNLSDKARETAREKASAVGEAIASKTSEAKDSLTHKAADVTKAVRDKGTESFEAAVRPNQKSTESAEPLSKDATVSEEIKFDEEEEIYHFFIGYQTAMGGGTEKVTLRSGKSYDVRIRPNSTEGTNLRLKKCGIRGNDAFLVLHTLYNLEMNIDRRVNNIVARSPIYERSKSRCLEAYNQINCGLYVHDLAALNLLDFLVSLSSIESAIGLRYTMASENSRWLGIDKCLESVLDMADFGNSEKQWLKATYQYIRAAEAIPNLGAWSQLNSIILNSDIAVELKNKYLLASAISMVLRVDMTVVDGVGGSPEIKDGDRRKYLSAYHQLREGKKVTNAGMLERLDGALFDFNIHRTCLIVYRLAREVFFDGDEASSDVDRFYAAFRRFKKVEEVVDRGIQGRVNGAKNTFSDMAVNQNMLANTAFDSVAGGGVGILGGVKLLKGGEASIAAAGLLAIATASEMTVQEKIRAKFTGAENFSAAAAYRGLMEAINESGWRSDRESFRGLRSGFGVGSLFKGKQEKQRILQQLETKLYS